MPERSLAVKGTLGRAKSRRALDSCGPFCRQDIRDGRLRRENNHRGCAAKRRFVSDPPAVPCLKGVCHREGFLLMGHGVCFGAGRFSQTQTSRTALRCSCKWMSGPANAWVASVTDRKRQIGAQLVRPQPALQETHPLSAGEVLFSLDKSLSWMSPFLQVRAGHRQPLVQPELRPLPRKVRARRHLLRQYTAHVSPG